MKVLLNGKFVAAKDAKISVFDAGFTSGYGIYETLRAEDGEIAHLNDHIERLFRSAKFVDLKLPWTKTKLKKWTRETLKKNRLKDARLRITVSFGSDPNYSSKESGPTLVIFAVSNLRNPKRLGFSAVTCEMERVLPEAKTTALLPQYLARQFMSKMKADEVFLVNRRDEITEGSVTNVFFVRGGNLITPKDGILKGTARAEVIETANKLRIKVVERAVKLQELKNFNECFVTNAPKGVVPVLRIDKVKISDKIGPLTKLILEKCSLGKL
ncbi:MAG: aminotransferase class IV [Patescibacteria group bacterium]|nr:aminotransferase class IV [Patescibacteria group bacterium]